MIFTKENSLQDILEYPHMEEYLKVFYSDIFLGIFTQEYKNMPLCQLEKRPHILGDNIFSAAVEELLMAAELICELQTGGRRMAVSLWEPGMKEWDITENGYGKCRKEDVFLVAPRFEAEKGMKKPGVIICPGGGYERVCFSGEGTPVMKRMEKAGYVAFMLGYRVAPASYPQPQEDLDRALQYVRKNCEYYGVDPEDIMIMGFSAGGHLCGSIPIYSQMPPNKVCLCYPVISMGKDTHEGSVENLTKGDEDLKQRLSLEERITANYPKTFIWTLADDDCVPPNNTIRMMEALDKMHVPFEGHIYASGGHGCGLATGKSAEGWLERMIAFMRN